MTPDEYARTLYDGPLVDCINVTMAHSDCIDPAGHIADCIRAALRERDAQWAAAVENAHVLVDPGCLLCAPLRALLGEAK